VEVAADDVEAFIAAVPDSAAVGTVTADAVLHITAGTGSITLPVADLVHAWAGHVPGIQP
jgi:hypothetical protein